MTDDDAFALGMEARLRAAGFAGLLGEIRGLGAVHERDYPDLCERIDMAIADQEAATAKAVALAETQWSSSGARSDETNPGLKERPEPALTDEQIMEHWNRRDECLHGSNAVIWFARAIERAALSHRSSPEPDVGSSDRAQANKPEAVGGV